MTLKAVCPFFFVVSLGHAENRWSGEASSHIMESTGALLVPCQLGYGTLQGAEAAVLADCLFLDNLQPGGVILKLDFKNTVNTSYTV